MSALEWLLVRGLDLELARGELPPAWLAFSGLVAFGLAVAALTWLGARARQQRRAERDLPEPEPLLDSESWLADRTEPIPPVVLRRTHRYPVARHVPVAPSQEWPTIVLPASDPDATLTLVRPRDRWGAQ